MFRSSFTKFMSSRFTKNGSTEVKDDSHAIIGLMLRDTCKDFL